MEFTNRFRTFVVGVGLAALVAPGVLAVPYASGVRNTMDSTWEFVLNEAADNVTVTRVGGTTLELGALTPGRHTFDMETFTDFEIDVAKNASTGWTQISDVDNLFTNFERPNGVVVNNNPVSPYFGTIYVNNGTNLATATGRAMGDGVYAMTADMNGVDLANNFAVVTDPNDASQAKAVNWTVTNPNGTTPAGIASVNAAWRIALDEAGNIIASDWSDFSGGVKYMSPDLATGGLILRHEDGITPLLDTSPDGLSGGDEIHGSIVSRPYVTGSVGNNLTLYALDEDYDLDKETLINASSGNHLWKWNVGDATDYNAAPELVVSASALAGANSDGSDAFMNLNVGVLADAYYSPVHDKWYLSQPRNDGTQSGIAVVTADGVDGMTPTLEWSSKEFSIENNLDGFSDVPSFAASTGIQDILREAGSVTISPDGTKLFVHRAFIYGEEVEIVTGDPPMPTGDFNNNPYLGRESGLGGAILIIPLDENGIPDIQIDDNGTPDDTSDDTLANVESIDITNNDGGRHTRHDIVFDAAGNFYITNNVSELIEVFSPGGNTIATTTSDGTFNVETLAGGTPGDYNGDSVVDANDYTAWKSTFGQAVAAGSGADGNGNGIVDAADYTVWRDNAVLGGNGSGAGSGAVPEPGSLALLLLAALGLAGMRRRR